MLYFFANINCKFTTKLILLVYQEEQSKAIIFSLYKHQAVLKLFYFRLIFQLKVKKYVVVRICLYSYKVVN